MTLDPPAKIDRRERRGAATREHILDTTVRAIVNHGYHGLTTTMVAKAARVSRGAMLHHFPSRDVLIAETVQFLFRKRLVAFEKMVAEVTVKGHPIAQSLEIFAAQAHHPYFIAFFELSVAARTDKTLHALLTPRQHMLDARSLELARRMFPHVSDQRLEIGLGLSQAVVEHLALRQMRRDATAADDALLQHLHLHIRAFYGLDAEV